MLAVTFNEIQSNAVYNIYLTGILSFNLYKCNAHMMNII